MQQHIPHRNDDQFLTLIVHVCDALTAVSLIPVLSQVYAVPWRPSYTLLCVFVFFLANLLFFSTPLYQPWRGQVVHEELSRILKTWAVLLGFVFLALFITKSSYNFSRRILLTWSVLGPFAIYAIHALVRFGLRCVQNRGSCLKRAVIIGAGDLGASLNDYLRQIPWSGIRVQGFFDDCRENPERTQSPHPLLGTIDDLPAYLERNPVETIFIALPFRSQDRIKQVLSSLRTCGAQVLLIPDLSAYLLFNAEIQTIGQMVLVNFNPDHPRKRLFDLVFSACVLLVLSPLLGLIALLITLEDRGPVLFRHRRITLAGRPFDCLKFRTMHVNAEAELQEILQKDPAARQEWQTTFKLKNDPRVTRIGRILRRTSLDELPQFFNVLKGEMSVVGVRPIVQEEMTEYYHEKAGLYCSIKPGITGPWQVDKRSDVESYEERIGLDTRYILNSNAIFDLQIILKTVWKVLTGRGAY